MNCLPTFNRHVLEDDGVGDVLFGVAQQDGVGQLSPSDVVDGIAFEVADLESRRFEFEVTMDGSDWRPMVGGR